MLDVDHNHFYGFQRDLALTCSLCLLFVRSSQAGGHTTTKQHTGLKKFSRSLLSQKSNTRQTNLPADVQNQETKPRIPETNIKIGITQRKTAETLLTRTTRQTGSKGQEGLAYIPEEGGESLGGEKHTDETHKVN